MQIKDLSNHDTAFCDSIEAIEIARDFGLPSKCLIKTSSPAVILNSAYKTIQIDSKWNLDRFREVDALITIFINQIYKEISLHTDIVEYAHIIARFSFNFPLFMYKASCIEGNDLVEKRLIIDIDHENKNINPPWKILLANNKQTDKIVIQTTKFKKRALDSTQIPILDRLRISGFESIVYKLATKTNGLFPNFLCKDDIFVASSNELIVEACYELIKKRYRIKEISPESFESKISADIFEKIKKVLYNKVLVQHVGQQVIEELIEVCCEFYFESLKDYLDSYISYKLGWDATIKKISNKRNIIFSNSPSSIHGISLFNSSRDKALIVSTQHGVTDEICGSVEKGRVVMEVNASDLFLAYNDQEVLASEKSIFKQAKSIAVGMSLKHLRMNQNYFLMKINYPIVYIATDLYRGNNGHGGGLTDYEKALSEIDFIENVLAKLPYKVLYKSYPEQTIRYPDLNPVFEVISKSKNIKLYDKKVDMRYLMMRHKVFITSKATSTVSWPMLSSKPLIFINQKSSPLNSIAYESFKKSVFLFDDESPDFYKNILKLLSLPIGEIEDLWKSMASERNKTINIFFTKYKSGAGKRSVRLLESYLNHDVFYNTNP